jgi:hypothetical protein
VAFRYLIQGCDSICGQVFQGHVEDLGLNEVVTALQSTWQNPYVVCIIGSIRQEFLNQVIARFALSARSSSLGLGNLRLTEASPPPYDVPAASDLECKTSLGSPFRSYRRKVA